MAQLVITEKPSVARQVADVLGVTGRKDGYMEGNGYIVSWCIGHLVELAQPGMYKEEWKKWDYGSLPIIPKQWKYTVKENTREQYGILCSLLNRDDVETVICATDAGREGELIFRLVYRLAGCSKPVKRLWVSSLEESAIKEGFANLKPGSSYDRLYHSALCRQEADWLVGINATRLFTVLYGGRLLRAGRVQTPVLAMLVKREGEITGFKKEQYFTVDIRCNGMYAVSGRINSREEAEKTASACQDGKAVITSVTNEEKTVMPPGLYDLTSLQRDANRYFGYTAKQTLVYAQSLYEKKLITYPRTDSRYLSEGMEETAGYVLHEAFKLFLDEEKEEPEPDTSRIINSREVTDHHAIIPTKFFNKGCMEKIPETEKKILYLITGRLVCATAEKHIYRSVKATVSCNGHVFAVSGKTVVHNGWKDFQDICRGFINAREDNSKSRLEEEDRITDISEGQVFINVKAGVAGHYTKPPAHYTEDTLLCAMENAGASGTVADAGGTVADICRHGLGTPATRADIIEKLVKDGFARRDQKQLIPTEDGVKLVSVLPDTLKSPKLTAEWENALALVAEGRMDRQEFIYRIEAMVSGLVQKYKDTGNIKKDIFTPVHGILGKCPACGGDVVSGKYGAYCIKKCGMDAGHVMGVPLTDAQVKDIISGKKIFLKGLKSRQGKSYDAYITADGTEEYSYTKNGEEKIGLRFKVAMEFPRKK